MTTSQGPWPGRFVWHDLMTTDAKKSHAYYGALFDWQIDEQDMMGHTYRKIIETVIVEASCSQGEAEEAFFSGFATNTR